MYAPFSKQLVHTPQIGAPIAQDENVRVALVIDNPGNMPAFGIAWQRVDTTLTDEWCWIGGKSLWQLPSGMGYTGVYTSPVTGTVYTDEFKDVLRVEGENMIFDWLTTINDLLKTFLGLSDEAPDPVAVDDIEVLYSAIRSINLVNGQATRS